MAPRRAAAKKPAAKKPATRKAAVKRPVTKKPAAKKPAVKKPAVKKPAVTAAKATKVWPTAEFNKIMKEKNFGYLVHTTSLSSVPSILEHGKLFSMKALKRRKLVPKDLKMWSGGREEVVYTQVKCRGEKPGDHVDHTDAMLIFDKKLLNSRRDSYANLLWDYGDRLHATTMSSIRCEVLNEVLFPDHVDLEPFLKEILIWEGGRFNMDAVPPRYRRFITFIDKLPKIE